MTRHWTVAFAVAGSGAGAPHRGGNGPQLRSPSGAIARGAGREHGIRGAVDRRDDDRGGPGVERGADPRSVHGRHAHGEGGAGIPERATDRVEVGTGDGTVLRIEREPVETAEGQPTQQVDVGA